MRRRWIVVLAAAFAACGRSPLWVDVDPDAGPVAGTTGGHGGAGASGASGGSIAGAGGVAGTGGIAGTGDVRKRLGESCAESIDCVSAHCVQGACCESACEGDCSSCMLPGSVGRCQPLGVGSACGTAPTCAADGVTVVGSSVCDGKGSCRVGPSIVCAPYACAPATGRCHDRCASDADCAPGVSCVNGSCGFRVPTGACAADSECASGHCADGVCCDRACDGKCQFCAIPGRVGVCSPVSAGTLDPHGFCFDQGAASCGFNGRCDDTGGCQRYAPGATCSAPTCVGATLTLAGTCNGQGACLAPIQSCAPAACRPDGTGCETTAACSGASCAAGF